MKKKRRARISRWLHKWLGLIFSVFFVLWAISGIVLNHRGTFSPLDVNRNVLPSEYAYENWNLAAVRGAEKIGQDSILLYGNIGIWLTDSQFERFESFNHGFPSGVDNKKISKVLMIQSGKLFAGTYFGLYKFDYKNNKWTKIHLPAHEERITDLREKGDSLIVMTRSFLWFGLVNNDCVYDWQQLTLPPPEGYDNKVGLFRTLWVIHSGEIYGLPGKLIIDFVGLVFIFLSITGVVYFFMPYIFRRRRKKNKPIKKHARLNKWSLRWHNKIGIWLVAILIINTLAGMFLRPPLLITIANTKVAKIKYSYLDNPNPWFDKLRSVIYDEALERWIIGTNEGIYFSEDDFSSDLKYFPVQPPVSVMGINVFEQKGTGQYLVGSFSGLFRWIPSMNYVENYVTKSTRIDYNPSGPPLGQQVVAGYLAGSQGREYFFDYDRGAIPISSPEGFTPMPKKVKNQPMSLWNVMLEVHTARFFRFLFGDFYILFIPLFGIFSLSLLITGLVVWLKVYWRRKKK
ncbi:MAG: PepSY domain-containing protein [Bacteroidales bacterium]|nr:PepSY domain-containing protein [Bacteroidales bacterium]MCF8386872.1 PepSY domain-containing protein [Bacteroidales bacterium]MCF8396559.1 PepSY domain-containing protein [Bacteroidales bacterium]